MIDTRGVNQAFDLLAAAESLTSLQKVAQSEGGEWAGPCPVCGGRDRFRVQPRRTEPRWLCRHCTQGKWRDGIAFVMQVNHCDFKTALERMGAAQPVDPHTAAEQAAQRAEQAARELQKKIKEAQKALEELRRAQSWLRYHEQLTGEARGRWESWGIPEYWQEYWKLGYDPDRVIWTGTTEWHTPTMTIPVFQPETWSVLNVRHRLLIPPRPGDKYRPERGGLPQSLWVADPDEPLSGRTLIVEGEKKAMVAYLTADDACLRVAGLPGKNPGPDLIEQLGQCDPVYICLDPDAQAEGARLAADLNSERCRIIELPEKIDDMVLRYRLDQCWMRSVMRTARKV